MVESATIAGGGATASAAGARRGYRVRLSAHDRTSGVGKAQLAASKAHASALRVDARTLTYRGAQRRVTCACATARATSAVGVASADAAEHRQRKRARQGIGQVPWLTRRTPWSVDVKVASTRV